MSSVSHRLGRLQIEHSNFTNNVGVTYGGAIAAGDRCTANSTYLTTPNIFVKTSVFVNNSAMVRV